MLPFLYGSRFVLNLMLRVLFTFFFSSVDNEAQKLLKILRDEKLPKKMPTSNTARFTVDWSGKEGIDEVLHKVR